MSSPRSAPASACVLQAWLACEQALLHYLLHHTGDRYAAEDLLQETFLKSMRQGQHFCALRNPRAWLFRVARNALIDSARCAKPHEQLPEQLAQVRDDTHLPLDQLADCVEPNLAELDANSREIVSCCDLQGQTLRAFAEAHGLTLPAAKSRLLRARKRLRDQIVANCQVGFDESGQVSCYVPRGRP